MHPLARNGSSRVGIVLRRDDGTFVAAFSVKGAAKEGLVEPAREDYGALMRRSA